MIRHLPKLTVVAALAVLLLVLFTSCASRAGQVTASEGWPIVNVVTARQRAYLEAGKLPDGRPIPPAMLQMQLASLVTLRNLYLAALGQPLEELPAPPDLADPAEAGGGVQ